MEVLNQSTEFGRSDVYDTSIYIQHSPIYQLGTAKNKFSWRLNPINLLGKN